MKDSGSEQGRIFVGLSVETRADGQLQWDKDEEGSRDNGRSCADIGVTVVGMDALRQGGGCDDIVHRMAGSRFETHEVQSRSDSIHTRSMLMPHASFSKLARVVAPDDGWCLH